MRARDRWPERWPEPEEVTPRRVGRWLMVAAVVVLVVFPAVLFVLHLLSRPAQLASRVTDPDRLLATYEGYYDRCTQVAAYDANVADAKTDLDRAERAAARAGGDPLGLKAQDVQQARTNLQGLVQRRRELAAAYNADSLKITNLNGLTKGDDLPVRIDDGVTPACGHKEVTAG